VNVGRRVRALRDRLRMSREHLAEASDVDVSFLSRLERGRVGVSLLLAHRIASALGISLEELSGRGDTPADVARARKLVRRAAKIGEGAFDVADAVLNVLERKNRGRFRGK